MYLEGDIESGKDRTVSLESDYFKRYRPDFRRLEPFGFRRAEGKYVFADELMDGWFRAEVEVRADGTAAGRIIDLDTEEEYTPIRLQNQTGEFVGTVREEYLALLDRIRKACFIPVSFIYDQANRIEAWIHQEFNARAEFPWEKYPGNGTFKCPGNDKWFAAVLTVAYGKLEDGSTDAKAGKAGQPASDEIAEVINLKADPDQIPELVKRPGIYRAWHMNKKHWISVILDDTLADDDVADLIRASYELVRGGKAKKYVSSGAWMIPSNPRIYDVDEGFRQGGGIIEWHQHNKICAGDEVYIYCSAPYSALIYRCEVVASDLDYHGMFEESKGYPKAMQIRLLEKFPPDKFPLSFIKAHGGSVVRSARTMPEELHEAVLRELLHG